MADSVDWTDETLRPLDELARLAFPDGGVTADTLKRRARQGKLAVYRPGKAYLASLSDIWAMIIATRVRPKTPPPAVKWERPTPPLPDPLGRTDAEVAHDRTSALLRRMEEQRISENLEAKRLRDEKRAREAPARKLRTLERRRARARAKYREKVAERHRGE
jgi:hypothetical protein